MSGPQTRRERTDNQERQMTEQLDTRLTVARSAMIASTNDPELYNYYRAVVKQLEAERDIAAETERAIPPQDPQSIRFGFCPLCDELDDLTDEGICYGCRFIADEATSGLYTYAPEAF
jgi:hypothetical protein